MKDMSLPHTDQKGSGVHVPTRGSSRFTNKASNKVFLEGERKQMVQGSRDRVFVTAILFVCCFVVLGLRLVDLTVFKSAEATQARTYVRDESIDRAEITDRNGDVLATNLAVPSVFADSREIWDVQETAIKLKGVFPELNIARLTKRLSCGSAFVWIKRDITPKQQQEVHRLGLPGVGFRMASQRVYPNGSVAAHVLGYVDIDNHGIAGIEKTMDDALQDLAHDSQSLKLSLDLRAQHAMTDELVQAMDRFNAKAAAGLVMDVHTGEILSMVSLPDFDPNLIGESKSDQRFNRATLGTYEMGSTFKTFTVAMALDSGFATMNSRFDATTPIRVGRFSIRDYHAENRWLSLSEVFLHSSNIGSAKIATKMGAEAQQQFLRKLGLLSRAPVELPEVGAPLYPDRWGEISTMTISFGHGIAVSPVQLAAATSSLVNGGTIVKPTILKRSFKSNSKGRRIVSKKTSQQVRTLLRDVVQNGTGGKAAVAYYDVGGKTGTAEKPGKSGYKRKALLSSFLGAFPMNDPKYVVFVMLDEPQGTKETYGYATGGWTAAPTVANVIERLGFLFPMDPVTKEGKTVLASF